MSYRTKTAIADDMSKVTEEFTPKELLDYDPVGLPDDKDLHNISNIIRNHEKVHPGEVRMYAELNKRITREVWEAPFATGLTNVDRTRTHTMKMPICLFRDIQESYPLMFTNKKHLAFFKKHFPAFTVGVRR